MNPPQVPGVRPVLVGIADSAGSIVDGIGQLGERRQRDALLAEALDAVGERCLVDDPIGQTELVLEGDRGLFGALSS